MQQIHQYHITKPVSRFLAGVVAITITAATGFLFVNKGLAATYATASEAEDGGLQGNASLQADANASAGHSVVFSTPGSTSDGGCAANGVATPCIGNTTTGDSGWGTPVFDDEFNGSSVDSTKWATNWFGGTSMNGNQVLPSNISFSNGSVNLGVASNQSGAVLTSNPSNGSGPTSGFEFGNGTYVEARILFPGSGSTIYNWPAWWTDGQNWPDDGEADIFEGLGTATSNYHYSNNGTDASDNSGTISGIWSNNYHTYGLYRQAGKNDIYWDGQLVRSYTTYDNGALQYLLLTNGPGQPTVTGATSQMKVDYVRAWHK